MGTYDFFVAHLRFIAGYTDPITPEIEAMMNELKKIADAISKSDSFTIEADRLRFAARGLAGLAGFLQKEILPEVVAENNATGEKQVRWVIDNSMAMMANIMVHAEKTDDKDDLTLTLPTPPEAAS